MNRTFQAIVLALGAHVLLAGCAANIKQQPLADTLAGAPQPNEPYTIQPGDGLSIKFYRNPELNEEVVVRPDGMISLQLINEVPAAGRRPADLSGELAQRYANELTNPDVTVIVKNFGGQRIFVSGEVSQPGPHQLSGGLTLYQAIQQAGGFQVTARRSQVILIRRDANGKPTGHAVDLEPVESGEHPELDVPLRPYDVVFVPRSAVADVNVFVDLYINRNLPPMAAFFLGAAL